MAVRSLLLVAAAALLTQTPMCDAKQLPVTAPEAAQKQQQTPVLQALQAAAATMVSRGAFISVPAATAAAPSSSCNWNGETYLQGTWAFCPQCKDYSYCYCCNGAWTHCGSSQDWQISCYSGLGIQHDWHDDRIMIVDRPLDPSWNTNPGHDDHHHDQTSDHHHDHDHDHDQIFDHHDHDQIINLHEDHSHEVQGSIPSPVNPVSHDNIPSSSFGGWGHHDSSTPGTGSFSSIGSSGLASSSHDLASSSSFGSHDFGSSSLGSSSFSSHDFGSSSFGGGGFSSHDFGGSSFGGGGGGGHHGRKMLRGSRHRL